MNFSIDMKSFFLPDRKCWCRSILFDDRKVCAISRDFIAGTISCFDSTNWNYRAFIFELEFVFNMKWFSIFKQEIFDLSQWQKCAPKPRVSISKVKELFFHKLQNWRALWSNFFQYSYKAYSTKYLRYIQHFLNVTVDIIYLWIEECPGVQNFCSTCLILGCSSINFFRARVIIEFRFWATQEFDHRTNFSNSGFFCKT